jgi:predicted amidohydrolase YtcJ
LKGKIVLPAFTDTHTHFVEMAKRRIMVDLSNCQSLDEIRTELTGFRERINTAWVLGGGWDKNILDHPRC